MINLEGRSTSVTADRVKTNGEVFTPDRIVNKMLDETDRKLAKYFNVGCINNVSDDDYISYIILEPTCGNGNFLIRELDRKLKRVANYSGDEQEIALLKAISSIHCIDITAENVVIAKLRMMEVIETGSTDLLEYDDTEKQSFSTNGFKLSLELKLCIQYILDRNIQCGNTLESNKILIHKSKYIKSIWELNKNKINDGIIRNSEIETNKLDLVLTQYDFDSGKIAIRERTYKNMHEACEEYRNTSQYVNYNKLYTLDTSVIFEDDIENESYNIDDDYDF